jgi:superfamily II DNA/RNA helicase
MDIPDIDCVVQFMVALSLSVLVQRFGRAGRSGQPVVAILLTEPSVFQVRKKNEITRNSGRTPRTAEDTIKEEPTDDDSMGLSSHAAGPDEAGTVTEYRKKMEVGMQEWCLALGCRWEVLDKYFNNPPRPNSASYESFHADSFIGLHCQV